MFFERIYDKGLAQASYIIGCQATKEAIVMDPKRDIHTYLEVAARERLNITHVTETHIHADFLSGSRELAALTGAKIFLSDLGGEDWAYQFDHTGLKDGDSFFVGNLRFDVIHTPGHTPEHISFLLTDLPASEKPIMIFTGDFVFVGDVGRPDLLEVAAGYEGSMETGARQMFASLRKFKQLPDHIQLWPGHGAGSACGKALGAVPGSTIGYEKLVNWALQIEDENKFIEKLLEGQPEPPKYFAMMKRMNKNGPKILGSIPHPARLSVAQFQDAAGIGMTIVDTRKKNKFAEGHITGSLNIQDNNSLSTWAGWLLDYEKPFILIASDDRIEDITKSLIRIGLDNIFGYFPDIEKINLTGQNLKKLSLISAEELHQKPDDYFVIDVRGKTEFEEESIPGSLNTHAGSIPDKLDSLPSGKPIVVYCNSGDRSSVAASLLLKYGFNDVLNFTGGIEAWKKKGFNTHSSLTEKVST